MSRFVESFERNTNSETGNTLSLHEHYVSDIEPGIHSFEVEQEITYVNKKNRGERPTQTKTYTRNQKIFFGKNRFSLDRDAIKSYYPPKNEYGGLYTFCLPHIVFVDPALPWEWSAKKNGGVQDLSVPWLALLVFNLNDAEQISGDESIINSEIRKPEDLLAPENGICCYPDLHELFEHEKNQPVDSDETQTKTIQTIDIPAAVFNQIAPTIDDLPYLAHVRRISTEARSQKSSDFMNKGELYSVVIANRLPKSTKNIVHLVSLLGMAPYLPSKDGASQLPTGTKYVRLVSFDSWQFGVNDDARDFQYLVAKTLDVDAGDPSTLRLPNPSADTVSPESSTVENALAMGYIAMNHETRLGDETVSWYRGPLVPYGVNEVPDELPTANADALVRYDSTTGLFDVTYAAAWQLGRLLALQNLDIATELYNWKIQNNLDAIRQFKQQVIRQSLPDEVSTFLAEGKSVNDRSAPATLGYALLKALAAQKERLFEDLPEAELPETRQTQEPLGLPDVGSDALREMLNGVSAKTLLDRADPALPGSVKAFLGELELLKGVPYTYLVPDERMLPFESLRFFRLDRHWIECLKDGVLSIGRNNSSILSQDKRNMNYFREIATTISSQYRAEYLNIPNRINIRNLPKGEISGFILHSTIVEDFPGMAVRAFSDTDLTNPRELEIFHFESIGNYLKLFLCQGIIEQVRFSIGSEELNFVVDRNEDTGKFCKAPLRKLDGDYGPIGDSNVAIPFRHEEKRVINIRQLADDLDKALKFSNESRKFTAAEFAFQMIDGPPTVIFWTQDSQAKVGFGSQAVDASVFLPREIQENADLLPTGTTFPISLTMKGTLSIDSEPGRERAISLNFTEGKFSMQSPEGDDD